MKIVLTGIVKSEFTERVELGEEGDGPEADEGQEDDEEAGDRL